MIKLPKRLLAVLLPALLLLGLLLSAFIGEKNEVVKLTEGDAGTTVELQTGDRLEVELEGNPSTGYTWEVKSGEDLLRQETEPEFTAADAGLVGSNGVVQFEFEAVSAGETDLTLVYHRVFESDVDPAKTFSVMVKVK